MKQVKIGVVTDVHHNSIKNDMKKQMEKFVNAMNNHFSPDLVVELGDFCDHGELEEIDAIYSKCDAPRYYVMGNHDIPEIGRSEFKKTVGISYDWTSITVKFLHIVFLDATWGNIIPPGRCPTGHIPKEELEWLEEDLINLPRDQPIVAFCHYPIRLYRIFGIKGGIDNEEELMSVFDGYNLVATFGGHYPGYGGYREINGVHHFALCNMRAGYTEITITPYSLEINEEGPSIHFFLPL